VFISGGTFYVDDFNRPILPIRDRAPEWGQMLAGARQYAFNNQYVAFVPGLVVAGAVFAFNLLGEGIRSAGDPFSSLSLSPRALGALGRALAVLVLVSASTFGVVAARSQEISLDEGLRLAREAVARVAPGDELIAAVVRFRSDAHALARPQKMNFYFRPPGDKTILRVGFENADQNTMDVKQYDDEDGLAYDELRPLGEWTVPWTDALRVGEDHGGRALRLGGRAWVLRVVLSQLPDFDTPTYQVRYSPPTGATLLETVVDARTGASEFDAALRFTQARGQARAELGGPVDLIAASASWNSVGQTTSAFGVDRPSNVGLTFMRSDVSADLRTATITFTPSGVQVLRRNATGRPPALKDIDIVGAFAAVENAGGRAVREQWGREGVTAWTAFATIGDLGVGVIIPGVTLPDAVAVTYTGGGSGRSAAFRYDIVTGAVQRIQ